MTDTRPTIDPQHTVDPEKTLLLERLRPVAHGHGVHLVGGGHVVPGIGGLSPHLLDVEESRPAPRWMT